MSRPTTLRDAILAQLQSGPMTATQIGAEIGASRTNVMNSIRVMCERGILRRKGFLVCAHPAQMFVIAGSVQ